MAETILVVDDNPRLLSGARFALELNGFAVKTAYNGRDALHVLQETRPNLIVSDILMPECDGFSLLEQVHAHPEWVTIPFMFMTALDDQRSIERGRSLGVDDYLVKPFSPKTLVQTVRSRLERSKSLENAHTSEAFLRTITIMARAIEARDPYTGGHVERVAHYAQTLARALDWSPSQINEVRLAGMLHDVGKIGIPDIVLNKPGPLSSEEWEIMKQHPLTGIAILSPLQHMPIILDGVRSHHESYDGNGYPDHLAGDAIPPVGRLLAIVDAYDAMTNDRAYRKALSPVIALERIAASAGTQFDPAYVEVFKRLFAASQLALLREDPTKDDNK